MIGYAFIILMVPLIFRRSWNTEYQAIVDSSDLRGKEKFTKLSSLFRDFGAFDIFFAGAHFRLTRSRNCNHVREDFNW